MKIYLHHTKCTRTGEMNYITKKDGKWVVMHECHHDFDYKIQDLKDSFALDAMLEHFQRHAEGMFK